MEKYLQNKRLFNSPITITKDTIVNQTPPPPTPKKVTPTPKPEPKIEEIIPEPIQEEIIDEVQEEIIKPKRTRKKKTDEGY